MAAPTRRAGSPAAAQSVAVRLTDSSLAARLCRAVGHALVSTSANVSRRPPLRACAAAARARSEVDYVLAGALGGLARPTVIKDGRTGEVLRPA